tara:strand:+ start:3883 stop:4146 length:264 start_codon:yes stop_codon:yes gene_type:complete
MSKNVFETKLQEQINNVDKTLTEGFLASVILRALYGSKGKKLLKKAAKVMKKDPELQAAFSDLKYSTEHIKDLLKQHCDEFPDDRNC